MTIIINGIQINYIAEGAGHPVLLLHGWGASVEAFSPVIARLKERFRVYAFDFPGFGKSTPPPDTFSIYDYADLTERFIKEVIAPEKGNGRLSVIAHSFGGRVSILLASRPGSPIVRLVLADAAGIRPKKTFRRWVKVFAYKTGKMLMRIFLPFRFYWLNQNGFRGKSVSERREQVAAALKAEAEKHGSADYRAAGSLRPVFVRVVNEDLTRFLPDVKCPTLLVWGENDTDTPPYMARKMERLIPDSGIVLLKGAGHYSFLDSPGRFMAAVTYFLSIGEGS